MLDVRLHLKEIADMKVHTHIASPPDREHVVFEIFFDDEQFAEVNKESDTLTVEIYPRGDGTAWALPVATLGDLLNQATLNLDT